MKEAIVNFFLETLGRRWCVFLCSMLPIIELRGAIPLGAALGLPMWQSFLISVVGNMLPVPIILLFVKKVLSFMSKCKVKFFNKVANFVYAKAEKNKAKIEKYSFWGVALFVAIPLPLTGVWTGACVAIAIGLSYGQTIISVVLGNIVAGLIIYFVCTIFPNFITYLIYIFLGIIISVLVLGFIRKFIRNKKSKKDIEI